MYKLDVDSDSVSRNAVCLGLVFLLEMPFAPHRVIADARPLEVLQSSFLPSHRRDLKSISASVDTASLPVEVDGSSFKLRSFARALKSSAWGQQDCDHLHATGDLRYAICTDGIPPAGRRSGCTVLSSMLAYACPHSVDHD